MIGSFGDHLQRGTASRVKPRSCDEEESMFESRRTEPTQSPLDDEERELMDPDTWDWDAIEDGITVGEPGTIFAVEFSRDEHRKLADAACAAGVTTHEFIKQAALARLPQDVSR
jgi:hypothetical protein